MGAGFNNGLASMRGSIMSTARSITNAAASAMRSALKIHSPSLVTRDIGGYTGEGFAIGLDKQIKDVTRTARSMSEAVTENLQPRANMQLDIGGMVARSNARVNDMVQHQFNGLGQQVQPAYINLNMGDQTYRAYVEDISNEQGVITELDMQF